MADHDQVAMLKKDVSTWNAWRRSSSGTWVRLWGADLRGADIGLANLSGADLQEADLTGANLREAKLHGTCLIRANLRGTDLRKVDLREAMLTLANLHGANLGEADLTGANFREANLSQSNLSRTNLHYADLSAADLTEADLIEADLKEADLTGADLTRANLSGADLHNTKLRGTRLRTSNLSGANLSGANLQNRDLHSTNLRRANLTDADLRIANLQDVDLDEATLTNAKLWETLRAGWSIRGVVCERTFWDKDAVIPNEYAPGEFQKLYAESSTIELHYEHGITRFEVNTLPLLLHRLAAEHPDSSFRLRSIEEAAGGTKVVITVERGQLRILQQELLKLQEFQIQARLNEDHARRMERLFENVTADFFGAIPKIIEAAKTKNVTFTGPVGAYLDGGTRHKVTSPQTVNDSAAICSVLAEILGRCAELGLPSGKLSELEMALREIQTQLAAASPNRSTVQESAKTARNVLEGVMGSTIATALWPVITQEWLPALSKLVI